MTGEIKALRSEIIDVNGEVNRAYFETIELQKLLELMEAGDDRVMPDKERLHHTKSLLGLASRIAEMTAACLDEVGNRLDKLNWPPADCAATPENALRLGTDETVLLANYRACSEKEQDAIMQTACAMRMRHSCDS